MFEKQELLKAPNQALFGIKKRKISLRYSLGEQLIRIYQGDLLKATVMAAGGKVRTIDDSVSKATNTHSSDSNFTFVRDPVVLIPNKKLMLYTKGNLDYEAKDILAIGESLGYTIKKINKAYFEGGNIFYSPKRKVLLHGMRPGGRYDLKLIQHISSQQRKDRNDQIDKDAFVTRTNKALSKELASEGIKIYGLSIDPIIEQNFMDIYYHLDCFMQLLPDGRLVLLNKKILTEESQRMLQEIFGNDLIDLAYPEYQSAPFLFNFISFGNKVIAPNFPESIISALTNLGVHVITPGMLDATNTSTYNAEFSGGWVLALIEPVIVEFDKSIMKFPNTKRFVGGAFNDLVPNLQNPDNPVPLLKQQIEQQGEPHVQGGGG